MKVVEILWYHEQIRCDSASLYSISKKRAREYLLDRIQLYKNNSGYDTTLLSDSLIVKRGGQTYKIYCIVANSIDERSPEDEEMIINKFWRKQ